MVSISKVIGCCNRCGLTMECLRLCACVNAFLVICWKCCCSHKSTFRRCRMPTPMVIKPPTLLCRTLLLSTFAPFYPRSWIATICIINSRYAPSRTLSYAERSCFETKNIDATDFQLMHENDYERHVWRAHNDVHIRLGKMICQNPLINCPEISSLRIARAPIASPISSHENH